MQADRTGNRRSSDVLWAGLVTEIAAMPDVVANLLRHFERLGVRIADHRLEKGSTWVLDVEAGGVIAAQYLPPPA